MAIEWRLGTGTGASALPGGGFVPGAGGGLKTSSPFHRPVTRPRRARPRNRAASSAPGSACCSSQRATGQERRLMSQRTPSLHAKAISSHACARQTEDCLRLRKASSTARRVSFAHQRGILEETLSTAIPGSWLIVPARSRNSPTERSSQIVTLFTSPAEPVCRFLRSALRKACGAFQSRNRRSKGRDYNGPLGQENRRRRPGPQGQAERGSRPGAPIREERGQQLPVGERPAAARMAADRRPGSPDRAPDWIGGIARHSVTS